MKSPLRHGLAGQNFRKNGALNFFEFRGIFNGKDTLNFRRRLVVEAFKRQGGRMSALSQGNSTRNVGVSRPMVKGLFVASCLLSIVSWYTTEQGMALYLSTWFALLASLGVQSALVLVAWLIGFSQSRRALLIAVYAITAVVSIAFSYVSLYTWFSSRERPAVVERKMYDSLNGAADKAQSLLAAGISEGQKHLTALDEMTRAEKSHGYISRAQDADPYLAHIREAVAREAQTYNASYKEGAGEGLRYTAFDRYSKLARESLTRMQDAQRSLSDFRSGLKPLDSTENQLRSFRQVYDSIPWQEVREVSHADKFELPTVPTYSDFVDRSATGQEDLMIAFSDLFTAPTNRHFFAFALAAFIDIIVFLLAYASGPYFFGMPEERWFSASAAIDSSDDQIFVRNFLRKLAPSPQGMARALSSDLSPGEQQLCVLLVSKGRAVQVNEDGKLYYMIDQNIHEHMVESLSARGIYLRATTQSAGV